MIAKKSLRIAIFSANNPLKWSGGRYHGLMLALALGRAGHHVSYVTNRKPIFYDQVIATDHDNVELIEQRDLRAPVGIGELDFVVVVPLGNFDPEFYAAADRFARTSSARLVLVNFESGNWYNQVAPEPRDLRLWDGWRRLASEGALVLSSAATSDEFARTFYSSPVAGDDIRFEVWPPAINNGAAEAAAKEGAGTGVMAFVRPSDVHKGAGALLSVRPELLEGRTLHLVFNGNVASDFVDLVRARFPGSTVEAYSRISDREKFEILSTSKVLLFTSLFEGFGYPPTEAAFVGVESVCFDLPVLRETVGKIAHFAQPHDPESLNEALASALAQPSDAERRAELRSAVEGLVSLEAASIRASDIFLRNVDTVAPRKTRDWEIVVGPFPTEEPNADVFAAGPRSFAPMVADCVRKNDLVLVDLRLSTPDPITSIDVSGSKDAHAFLLGDIGSEVGAGARVILWLPESQTGELITVKLGSEGGQHQEELQLLLSKLPGEMSKEASLERLSIAGSSIDVALSSDGDTVLSTFKLEPPTSPRSSLQPLAVGKEVRFSVATNDQTAVLATVSDFGFERVDFLSDHRVLLSPPDAAERPEDSDEVSFNLVADEEFINGISIADGTLAVFDPESSSSVQSGTILTTARGRAVRVLSLAEEEEGMCAQLSKPLHPFAEGYPRKLKRVRSSSSGRLRLSSKPTDGFRNGIWDVDGSQKRLGFLVISESASHLSFGDTLRFAGSGRRTITGFSKSGSSTIVWVDRPISPIGDGYPHTVDSSFSESSVFVEATVSGDLRKALLVQESDAQGALAVERGGIMLERGGRRTVVGSLQRSGYLELLLDAGIPGSNSLAKFRAKTLEEEADLPKTDIVYQGGPTHEDNPSHISVRQTALSGRPFSVTKESTIQRRPRALFLTICPLLPTDQGNRVVTNAFVAHLVDSGFDVDVVLQGRQEPEGLLERFGGRVRIIDTPFPDWKKSFEYRRRTQNSEVHSEPKFGPVLGGEGSPEADRLYHPYFIVSDDMARLSRNAFSARHYDLVVFNYTHTLRLAEELRMVRELPPAIVITHDALSNLPTQFNGTPVDTAYRLCTEENERDVLNTVPGSLVLAISEAEQRYFKAIGVSNDVALCEFDGMSELENWHSKPEAFSSQSLIFHGSGNPMNVAALEWFLDNCWKTVRQAVPEARLEVCGAISRHVPKGVEGVEAVGLVSREELLSRLCRSTVAINPTVVGTGLKIKTVEAACLGLPSVCLPKAVEGIEEIANEIGVLAHDPLSFSFAVVKLLTDDRFWAMKRETARQTAEERFSAQRVYGAVDQFVADHVRPGSADVQPDALDDDHTTKDPRSALALQLVERDLRTAALPVFDELAADGVADFEDLLSAAQTATQLGYHDYAAWIAGQAMALDPWSPRSYEAVGRASEAAGKRWDAEEADRQRQLLELARLSGIGRLNLKENEEVLLNSAALSSMQLPHGWSGPEDTGIWSISPRMFLPISVEGSRGATYEMQIRVLSIPGNESGDQKLTVFIDGEEVGSEAVPRDQQVHTLCFKFEAQNSGGRYDLEFLTNRPEQPKSGGDVRLLGLRFVGIKIEVVPEETDLHADHPSKVKETLP